MAVDLITHIFVGELGHQFPDGKIHVGHMNVAIWIV